MEKKQSVEISLQVHELFMELTTTLQLTVPEALHVLDQILEIIHKRTDQVN